MFGKKFPLFQGNSFTVSRKMFSKSEACKAKGWHSEIDFN
jgi:hypothetical protein